jgi:hypothetical protein
MSGLGGVKGDEKACRGPQWQIQKTFTSLTKLPQALHPRRIVEDQAIPAAVLGCRLGVGAMMRWTTARASSLPTVCRTTIAACLAYEIEEEGNTLQRTMPRPLLDRTAAAPRACEQKARGMRP